MSKKEPPWVASLNPWPFADDRKRLTRKTSQKNVVIGDVFRIDGFDVPCRSLPKIGGVRTSASVVNVGREDALGFYSAFFGGLFKSKSKPADAAEQVYKTQRSRALSSFMLSSHLGFVLPAPRFWPTIPRAVMILLLNTSLNGHRVGVTQFLPRNTKLVFKSVIPARSRGADWKNSSVYTLSSQAYVRPLDFVLQSARTLTDDGRTFTLRKTACAVVSGDQEEARL